MVTSNIESYEDNRRQSDLEYVSPLVPVHSNYVQYTNNKTTNDSKLDSRIGN